MDRLQSLEVLLAVVDCGGFSRAAERLNLSPAAVTRHVAELEARLGVRLLHRSTRSVRLTETGSAYVERLRPLLDELAEADAEASAESQAPRGCLRISAPAAFSLRQLTPVLQRFRQLAPGVELDVELSDRRVELVEEGYDLALRISRNPGHGSLIARPLARIRGVLCAAPSYLTRRGEPREPEALARHSCLLYNESPPRQEWLLTDAAGELRRVGVAGPIASNHGELLVAAAEAGEGIIAQPTFLVGEALRAGRLRRVLPDWQMPTLSLDAVYASRRQLPAKVRIFIDFLATVWGDTPDWDRDLFPR